MTLRQKQLHDGRSNVVNVVRGKVLTGAMRAFSRQSFNPHTALSVKFVGEAGIDNGGLSVEFGRLLISEMARDTSVFIGPVDQKLLAINALSMSYLFVYVIHHTYYRWILWLTFVR